MHRVAVSFLLLFLATIGFNPIDAANVAFKVAIENVPDNKVNVFTTNVRASISNALSYGLAEGAVSANTSTTVTSLPPSPPPPPNPPPPSPPSPPPPPALQDQLDLAAFTIPFYLKSVKSQNTIDGSQYDTYRLSMHQAPGRLLGNETNFITALDAKTANEPLRAILTGGASFYLQTGTQTIGSGFGATTEDIIATPRTYVQNVLAADSTIDGVSESSRISLRREDEANCVDIAATYSTSAYTDSFFMNAQTGEELLFQVQRPSVAEADGKKTCHAFEEDIGLTSIDVAVFTVPENTVVELSFSLEIAPYIEDTVTVGSGSFGFDLNTAGMDVGDNFVYGTEIID